VNEEAPSPLRGGGGAVAAKTKNYTIKACKNKVFERVEMRKENANGNRVINYSLRFFKHIFGRQKRKYNDQIRF